MEVYRNISDLQR